MSLKCDLVIMLEVVLEWEYFVDLKECFFTGGGIYIFNNFCKEDDECIVMMCDVLCELINLFFVWLMKDIECYILYSEGYWV